MDTRQGRHTEDLPTDVTASPLYNHDLAPVPPDKRTWTTYAFAALWVSMAHCIPTYMFAGGLVAQGMSCWQALLIIGLGNTIVLAPILLNAHPGTRYGIPFPVLARASFGTVGANIPALLRAIVACGWFGIQTFIGGEAVKTFLSAAWPGFATLGGEFSLMGLSLPSLITFLIFWSINVAIVLWGMNSVRIFENWAAPLVLVMAAVLLVWIVLRAGGLGPLVSRPSKFATFADFWPVFVPALTGCIGFWATLSLNIPDFTRFGKGQRQQAIGQALGLPTTMLLFSAMAVIITSAAEQILTGVDPSKLWDPVFVLEQVTSARPPAGMSEPMISSVALRVTVALLALVGVGIATLATNIAANVVSPANDFANMAPRHINFKTGAVITGVMGIVMMPWKLLANPNAYIFEWLIGYSALLGPIAGIMIADYWIVRKQQLDVHDLYRVNGRYGRINPAAVIALAIGVLPNVPGFLHQVHIWRDAPAAFVTIYPYAWFTGVAIAGGFYVLLMRLTATTTGR